MTRPAGNAARVLRARAIDHWPVILCQRVPGERSVAQLQARLSLGQPALSRHLAIPRREGLARSHRSARPVFHSPGSHAAPRVLSVLYEPYCAPAGASR